MSGTPASAREAALDRAAPRRAQLEKALRDRLQRPRAPGAASPEVIDWPRIAPDPARRHEPFPLTDIQQAYWLGRNASFELGGVGIHGYFEVLCRGLDLPRLTAAWQRVVDRHDMMRAVVQQDGRQRILESVPAYEIATIDLRRQPAEVEAAWLAGRERMSYQVFARDLAAVRDRRAASEG